jgi:hypothetical protein
MARWKSYSWCIAVAVAMAGGFVLGGFGFWPHTPVRAMATDRTDSFAMATGALDNEVEAVYFLDFLTGELRALVVGKQARTWSGFFTANVANDLKIDVQRNPKFMMVTGVATLRRAGGSQVQPSAAACYVAELTTGKVAAYVVPWSPSMYKSGQQQSSSLALIGVTPFRAGATGGAGGAGGDQAGGRNR